MSHLFEHKGAGGRGYSQPDPIAPAENIQIPSSLVRTKLPRWPRLSEPEMVRHYTWLSSRITRWLTRRSTGRLSRRLS